MIESSEVDALAQRLAAPSPDLDDTTRIDLIRSLERLICVAQAAQADLTAAFDTSQRTQQAAAGVPAERQGRGVAAQIALARRESAHKGQQHLSLAKILPAEMPHTWAAFRTGHINEWRATLLARETACLSLEDRQTIDTELAGDPAALGAMGDREIITAAQKRAYALDPASFVERRRRAESDRHVSLRPAPDVMSHLSALIPVREGVSIIAALQKAADTLVAAGDPRSRGQLMADTLVARVTGNESTDSAGTSGWTASVIVPDTVLTGQSDAAGHVLGYGPVPADLARELATGATWLRRLYACPTTGALVTMDSTQRIFPDALKAFIAHRDRTCRMPWCDAAIRHTDHVHAFAHGGPTTVTNGQGLCEAHDYAKQAPGWHAHPFPDDHHTVETTTPAGHTYRSIAPPARDPVEQSGRTRGQHPPGPDHYWRLPGTIIQFDVDAA